MIMKVPLRQTSGSPNCSTAEDLFVYVYVLIDDPIAAGAIAIPPRPGPTRPAATPSC
jgi:hypothetical protein